MRLWLALVLCSGCIRDFKKLTTTPAELAVQLAQGSLRIEGTLGGGETSATLTATTAVSVVLVGLSTDVTKYRLANEPSFAGAEFAPVPSTGSVGWTLVPGSGTKTVYAQLQTENGTIGAGIAAQIALDDRPPTWGARGLLGNVSFLFAADPIQATVTVDVSDDVDSNDALQLAVTQDPEKIHCEDATLQPFADSLALTLSSTKATNDHASVVCGIDIPDSKRLPLYACAVDRAGNVSARFVLDFCLIGNSPLTMLSAPLPLLAQPLQTGARVTWSDQNTLSERIEIQYSTSSTFADGDPSVFSGSGACKPRVQPPVTQTIDMLTPGMRYFFRTRAIDCTGRAGPWSEVTVSATVGRGELVFPDVYRSAQVTGIGNDLFIYSLVSSSVPGDERMHVGRCDSAVDDCLLRGSWHFTAVPLPFHTATSADRMTLFGDTEVLFVAAGAYDGVTHSVVVSRCPRRNGCDTPGGWTSFNVGSALPEAAIESVAGRPGAGGFVIVFTRATPNVFGNGAHKLAFVRCDQMSPKGCGVAGEWQTRELTLTVDTSVPLTISASDAELTVGYRNEYFGPFAYIRNEGHAALLKCVGDCEVAAGPTGPNCADTQCDAWGTGTLNPEVPGAGNEVPQGVAHTGRAFPPVTARVHNRSLALFESTISPTGAVDMVNGVPQATLRLGATEYAFSTQSIGFSWEAPLGKRPLTTNVGRAALDVALNANKLDSEIYVHWIDGNGSLIQFHGNVDPATPRVQTVLATGIPADSMMSATLAGRNAYAVTTRDFSTVLFGPLVPTPADFFASPANGGVALGWRQHGAAEEMTLNFNGSTLRLPASVAAQSYLVASTGAVNASIAMSTAFGEGVVATPQVATPFRLTSDLQAATLASLASAEADSFGAVVDSVGALSFGKCTGACANVADWTWEPVDGGQVRASVEISADRPRSWIGLFPMDNTDPRVVIAGIDGASQTRISARDLKQASWNSWSVGGTVLDTVAPRASIVGDLAMVADVAPSGVRVHTCDGLPAPGAVGTTGQCSSAGAGRCYTGLGCEGTHGPMAGERPSEYCTQSANWKSVTLGITTGRTRAVAARVHAYYGFTVAEAHDAGLSFWSCQHSTPGGCRSPYDCGAGVNWVETPLSAAPGGAVDLLFAIGQADLGVSASAYRAEVAMISFADTAWRIALSYGAVDALGGGWFPTITDNFSGTLRGRDWVNVYLFDARSAPLSSTLRVVDNDIVLGWQEAQRMGISVCLGGANCGRSASWRTSVIDTGNFVPSFGQILPFAQTFSLVTTQNQNLRLFAGGGVH